MDFFRFHRKSTLGSHRSGNITCNDTTLKKFEVLPKSLQIAESLRKQRNTNNNENGCVSNIKNLGMRQPRKSMLGTRQAGRNSIIPPPSDLLLPPQNLDSTKEVCDSSLNDTLKSNESAVITLNDRIYSTASIEDEFSRRANALHELPLDIFHNHNEPVVSPAQTKKPTSPVLHRNVPIREMQTCSLNSKENSLIEDETMLAIEESVLATTMTDTTMTSETSILKDITNTCIDRTIDDELTLRLDSISEREESLDDNGEFLKMLALVNTWMRRSEESIESYEKEITTLQEKLAQTNEELEHVKNLKVMLMNQFSGDKTEIERAHESDSKPMATIPEDQVASSPAGTPTKSYFQEMRSTIKFMKTPLNSRPRVPRQSVMLTPHSMSFCLKNQYEQLFK